MPGGQTGRPEPVENEILELSDNGVGRWSRLFLWYFAVYGSVNLLLGVVTGDTRYILPGILIVFGALGALVVFWPKHMAGIVSYRIGWAIGGFVKAPAKSTITYQITEDGFTWIPFARYVDAKRAITEGADRYTDRIRKVADGKVVREMDL